MAEVGWVRQQKPNTESAKLVDPEAAYLGEPCTHQPLEETESCEESVTECLTQWVPRRSAINRAVEDKLIDTVRKLLDAQAFAKLPVRGNTPL